METDPPILNPPAESEPWPCGWDSHRRQQILSIAMNSTPAHRLQWLENMIDALASQAEELLRNRQLVQESMSMTQPISMVGTRINSFDRGKR